MIDARQLKAQIDFHIQTLHGATLLTAFTEKQRQAFSVLVDSVADAVNAELAKVERVDAQVAATLIELSGSVEKLALHVQALKDLVAARK